MDSKKQNVSVRLNRSDLRRIKEIAKRMQVRESDVYRYAVKSVLAKLMPLNDPHVKGKDLLPIFVDCYWDLTRYFDLDTAHLDRIINSDVEDPDKVVDRDDIELLVMAGIQESYALMRLKNIISQPLENRELGTVLKEYFMEKYADRPGEARTESELEGA